MPNPRTWLIDLGNSRLKWVRLDHLSAGGVRMLAHGGTFDVPMLANALAEVRGGDSIWLASVAGHEATEAVAAAVTQCGARLERARTRPALAGVRIAYAEPSRLGVDRFLALLAAHARARQPWLIASVGTALTIDLLATDGRHHGGLIAPSPTLMREALAQRAPHLPREGGDVVDFAEDTVDALASGAILSARALVSRSLRAARSRLGVTPTLLVAGGGADALLDGWRVRANRAPDLVLEGLAVYAATA